MAIDRDITDEQRGLAASYALGALDPAEVRAFEQELATNAALRAEVAAYRELTADLADAAPVRKPAPRVKQELMRRIGAAQPVAAEVAGQVAARMVIRAGEGQWVKTPFPGVEVKRLFVDPVTGMITTLLKAAAGAVYPAHVHGGVEQVFVIDGDMVFEDHALDTGDYEVATGESEHSAIRTPNGCLAIIIHSPKDQVVVR